MTEVMTAVCAVTLCAIIWPQYNTDGMEERKQNVKFQVTIRTWEICI